MEGARRSVEKLRSTSSSLVIYAELPGAQHSFDLFHSIRFETVVDAIEAFTAWVRSTRVTSHGEAQEGACEYWSHKPRPPSSTPRMNTQAV